MPSKDTFHEKRPEVNAWRELGAGGSPAPTSKARTSSAQLERLAVRLEKDADELAEKIPEDTLRRTKYPVLEIVNEDGSRSFKHDLGIEEGPRALTR